MDKVKGSEQIDLEHLFPKNYTWPTQRTVKRVTEECLYPYQDAGGMNPIQFKIVSGNDQTLYKLDGFDVELTVKVKGTEDSETKVPTTISCCNLLALSLFSAIEVYLNDIKIRKNDGVGFKKGEEFYCICGYFLVGFVRQNPGFPGSEYSFLIYD